MHKSFSHLDTASKKLVYKTPLIEAEVISRPNRYVAIVKLADGSSARAHTPVGGRIGGLTLDGLPCLLSGPYQARATDYTVEGIGLESSDSQGFQWVGIHQTASNAYVKEFLLAGMLPELAPGVTEANSAQLVRSEKKLGSSRIDFFVDSPDQTHKQLWIEVKTPLIKLHVKMPASVAIKKDFSSDSVGARMPKQITELMTELSSGSRAVLLGSFIYENTLKTSDELKLKDNLDLDGLITSGREIGLESWQITFKLDATGVQLIQYRRLF